MVVHVRILKIFRPTPGTHPTTPNKVNEISTWVEMYREMTLIFYIVTDKDGTLKLGRIKEFIDSKSYLEFSSSISQ